MATSNIPDDKLLCPVCLGQFERPRSLPCLHTFCTSCLRAHIETVAQGALFSSFLCPVCRANTKPPRPYSGRETWAEQFPVNYWILSFIDEQQSRNVEAEWNCETHQEMKITLFCTDHKRLCCAMCVATNHRKCNDVAEIKEVIKSTDLENAKGEVDHMVGALDKRFRDSRMAAEKARTKLENKKTDIMNTIRDEVESATSTIRTAENNLVTEMDIQYRNLLEDINASKHASEQGAVVCNEARTILSTLDKNEQPTSMFIKIQQAKTKLSEHNRSNLDSQNNFIEGRSIDRMRFELNDEFSKLQTLNEIGKIRIDPEQEEIVDGIQNETQSEEMCCEVNDSLTVNQSGRMLDKSKVSCQVTALSEDSTLRLVKVVNTASSNQNRASWITSAAPMKHSAFLVCDHKSASLKLIKDGVSVYEYVSERAWGVTKTSDRQVAVSYPQENRIRIYDVKSDVTSVKMRIFIKLQFAQPIRLNQSVVTSDACFGLCFTGHFLVAACEDCIQTYTLAGRRVQTVACDGVNDGLFHRVIDVTFCNITSIIYACDEVRNIVAAFNTDIMLIKSPAKFVYKNEDLRCPQSLAVGPTGQTIFVTGFVSRNIHVLNTDGGLLRIINVVQEPWAIAVDMQRHLLFLSYYPGQGQGGTSSLYFIRRTN